MCVPAVSILVLSCLHSDLTAQGPSIATDDSPLCKDNRAKGVDWQWALTEAKAGWLSAVRGFRGATVARWPFSPEPHGLVLTAEQGTPTPTTMILTWRMPQCTAACLWARLFSVCVPTYRENIRHLCSPPRFKPFLGFSHHYKENMCWFPHQ